MKLTSKEDILFIINPISGGRNKKGFEALTQENLDLTKYNPIYKFSTQPNHATTLALEGKSNGIKKIIAVGGDGTVNEVAKTLINSDVAFGIIPFGSGNGLARHMGIPLNTQKAIRRLNQPTIKINDAGKINDAFFFCTCGMGFDAHIGKIFASLKGRGFSGYVKAVLNEFAKYKAQSYQLSINQKLITEKAFLITFANASQYGNNAYIAPQADVSDGKLDVCILKPFPVIAMPILSLRIFSKSINKSSYMNSYKSDQEISILRNGPGPIHIDGEPFEMGEKITVTIVPKSLKIIV